LLPPRASSTADSALAATLAGTALQLRHRPGMVGVCVAEQDQPQILRCHPARLHVVQQVAGHLWHAAVQQHRAVGGLHQQRGQVLVPICQVWSAICSGAIGCSQEVHGVGPQLRQRCFGGMAWRRQCGSEGESEQGTAHGSSV
jgi:hypothetical protein